MDEELMQTFSTDQLMELAGLSVAEVIYHHYVESPSTARRFGRIVVVCGSGNNGGDGLVAARHLLMFRCVERASDIVVVYPRLAKSDNKQLYKNLLNQLILCGVTLVDSLPDDIVAVATQADGVDPHVKRFVQEETLLIDAIFGYSFSAGSVREPYKTIIESLRMANISSTVAIDIPSGWDVECGPREGSTHMPAPQVLVSLMLPKRGVRSIAEGSSTTSHYLGGRFVPPSFAEKYNLRIPRFQGSRQWVAL